MAEFPALPLFTDAYLADTRHLTTVQHGAYLLLLMEAWRRPSTNLPDDDMLLSKLAGLSTPDWADAKSVIMSFWSLDNRSKTWSQKRLLDEKSYVIKHSKKQRSNAKVRWDKEKSSSHGNATQDAKAMPDECQNDAPTPTPTPTPTDRTRGALDWATLESQLRKAAGWERESHPKLAVVGPIVGLIEAGASLEKDVLPIVKALASGVQTRTSWAYFLKPIEQSWRERTGFAAKGANGFHVQQVDAVIWAERVEWARKNQQWGEVWGPMPGKQGCAVPANLLKPDDGQGWTIWRPNA